MLLFCQHNVKFFLTGTARVIERCNYKTVCRLKPRFVGTAPSSNTNKMIENDRLDPVVPGLFDFSILFEQSILSLLPAALFIFLSPLRIYLLLKRQTETRSQALLVAKEVSRAVLSSHTFANYLGCHLRLSSLPSKFTWAMVPAIYRADESLDCRRNNRRPRSHNNCHLLLCSACKICQAIMAPKWLPHAVAALRCSPGEDLLAPPRLEGHCFSLFSHLCIQSSFSRPGRATKEAY